MNFIEPHEIRFAQAQIDAGAEMIFVGDALASQLGPQSYRQHVLDYERRLVRKLQEQHQTPVRLHICGNITAILQDVATTDAAMIDVDYPVDLRLACQLIGTISPKSYVVGNFNPVTALLNSTPDDVRRVCRQCERQVADLSNFILSAGCEVPPRTPLANYAAMLEFGWRAGSAA